MPACGPPDADEVDQRALGWPQRSACRCAARRRQPKHRL